MAGEEVGADVMSPFMLPVLGGAMTCMLCMVFMLGYYLFVWRPRLARAAKMAAAAAAAGTVPAEAGLDTRSYSLKTRQPVGVRRCRVLYATVKGSSKKYAEDAAHVMVEKGWTAKVEKFSDEVRNALNETEPILIVMPTYEDGKPPASCANVMAWLTNRVEDGGPKFDARPRYSMLGLGHSDYSARNTYNKACKDLHKNLKKLGARPFGPGVVQGDEGKHTQDAAFSEWIAGVAAGIDDLDNMKNVGMYEVGTEKDELESDDESASEDSVPDMEDMVGETKPDPDAEMINPRMRKALEKQGYNLIGSHSGVKLCRWTKAQMRGRGGCYKHTFYGITSYECMEMTPSLACANKCVFCWRHHTNPVAKEWKWKVDDPELIVDKAVEGQKKMIKPLKGVQGVIPERYAAAMKPSHCALSLVGEPIIYPEINKLVDCLHDREISSFMVTNAQFPEKIEELKPVTQLYISVDAATKDSMKKIDRPIFDDFWERFLQGVDHMRAKGQRTVFRLTLVKNWNATEVQDYGAIVQRGQPDFIEVKGVTWCGESTASNLTMSNVPFHTEVLKFCEQLAEASGEDYELACEHEHSCCVLIANKKFKKPDGWHTWIDFSRFHELIKEGVPFKTEDYLLPYAMPPSPQALLTHRKQQDARVGPVRQRCPRL